MMNCAKRERRERGQSMVEFAMVLPVVLLLIFGLLEFGRVLNGLVSAHHCANELARYALVGRDQSLTITHAGEVCPTLPDWTYVDPQITVTPASASRAPGSDIQVAVYYPVELVVPGIRSLFGGPSPCTTGIFCAKGRSTVQAE